MIIKGKKLSEETIVAACEAYGISFEKYSFQHGDIVENPSGYKFLIVETYEPNELIAVSYPNCSYTVCKGQKSFSDFRKIGELKDYIN